MQKVRINQRDDHVVIGLSITNPTSVLFHSKVLEVPSCHALSPLTLDVGDYLNASCFTDIPGATLLWQIGDGTENDVGENLLRGTAGYA